MNPQRRSFIRKIAYVVAVALLLLPLSWLSRPATTQEAGGKLAELRKQHGLSQASLGEIDPTSETIKLATLGMRGVAANVLWVKANNYRMKEDWTNLSATLEQITKLQPNFSTVWIHQGWNLAYNISVEFDNYRDRYYWVMRGINFLKEGIGYNTGEPRLVWELGWTLGNKIGRADERVLYRKMFVNDDDFHNADNPNRDRRDRDNWLVSREKFLTVIDMVQQGKSMRNKPPVLYYSDPAMMQFNYAEALQEEGNFTDRAQTAWKNAARNWNEFGDRDVATSFNVAIRLNDEERYRKRAFAASEKLASFLPKNVDVGKQIWDQRVAQLEPEERELVKMPVDQLTSEEKSEAAALGEKLRVTPTDLAASVRSKDRAAALRAADEAVTAARIADIIGSYREQINFRYWLMRGQFEQSSDGLAARKLIYEAEQAFKKSQLTQAHKLYDQGLAKWRSVIDRHPETLDHAIMVEDLVEIIDGYRKILHQEDSEFPKQFVLADVLEKDKVFRPLMQMSETTPATDEKRSPVAAPAPESEKPQAEKPQTSSEPAPKEPASAEK